MKITDLKEYKADKSEMLEQVDEVRKMIESGELDCLMIIALDQDGRQHLRTSNCSGLKKTFMVQFLNAWMAKWFYE